MQLSLFLLYCRAESLAAECDWHRGKDRAVKSEDMNKRLPNRREFNGLCLALGSSLSSVGSMIAVPSSASARAAAAGAASNGAGGTVRFRDGTIVPALGQGSGSLAQGRHPEAVEEEALRTGISLGMTLIDTAEMYGNGRSEELIGRLIAGQRDRVFLVSKVSPDHVAGNGIARACEARLAGPRDAVSRHVIGRHFGDQEYAVALTGNHPADQFLGAAVAVHLRRIDQRHPERNARAQRFFLNGFRMSPLRETPRALTERRHDCSVAEPYRTPCTVRSRASGRSTSRRT